ncbi:four-helix bundle copper-binding protein [Gemmata sp.]|uniref:four-helix bundle copper-binding protein n=1 Tax=Gemmata sp. TaxID=1914242 RepID=UPI003F6F54F7
MIRTAMCVVALACGGLLAARAEPAQPPIPNPTPAASAAKGNVDPKMPMFLHCAKACDDCARICDTCSAHCAKLVADGKKEHLATLRTCQDCADACSATARVAARDGPMTDLMAAACADVCKRCGDACEKHATDSMMKQCADECRRCEKVCRGMGKPPASGGTGDDGK